MDFIAHVTDFPEAIKRFNTYNIGEIMHEVFAERVWDIVPIDRKEACQTADEQMEAVLEYMDTFMSQNGQA